jgi:mRNA interferase MazF
MYHQYDIWWVDLNPTRGAETQKHRPCIVLQNNMMNKASKTIIIAPLLPDHKNWPFVVNITPSKSNGLDKFGHLNLKQLRAVDCDRIIKKQGVLEKSYQPTIQEVLGLIFGDS